MNCSIGNGLPCLGYAVSIAELFGFSTLAFAATGRLASFYIFPWKAPVFTRLQSVLVLADNRAGLAYSLQPPRLNGALPLYVARGVR